MQPVQVMASPSSRSVEALARFSLAGAECLVVDLDQTRDGADTFLGTFMMAGHRYAVLRSNRSPASPDVIEVLTPRELQIALLVAAGNQNKEIAQSLRISFHTVRVHVGRIYAKLGLHKQTELAALIAAKFGNGTVVLRE
ncbi:helix-turn-helix transcriptional regulator [Chelatococcus sp. SYSU_G07232]|uniref:Helix-turn-helix transcriptional regulator n=1 Tax=Chelatococcus albus TaxID=3047466 RepID=A0ABT7ABR9_9HYPH|nr:helix-turn-helix transcriptional regulator [Chelatococcus sp. SYSU_G07232]MDJ1156810.1 helix-turn-helix transcriptional regulator [Chelatococcus sp. SYSU_G07232]